MIRVQVIRKSVRWKKQTYREGDLLPEDFREKDIHRLLYPSRVRAVEIKTQPATEVPPKTSETSAHSEGTKNGTELFKSLSGNTPGTPSVSSILSAALSQSKH